MSEKNPSIDPVIAARVGTELVQAKRARIDEINNAVRNGSVSSLYGFKSDAMDQANVEVEGLEKEIRELEKKETIKAEVPVEEPTTIYNFQNPAVYGPPGEEAEVYPTPVSEISKKPETPIDYPAQARASAKSARENLKAKDYLDADTAWDNKPIEGISKLARTERNLKISREMREAEETIAELQKKIREMDEILSKLEHRRLTNPEVDISEPEPRPEDPFVTEKDLDNVQTTPEVPPAEQLIGASGAAAALEAFRQENELELARLRARSEGREVTAGASLWERAAEKGSRTVSWFKERAKGLATFGYWEVRQAEKVRKAGSDVSKEMEVGSRAIRQEVFSDEDRELIKSRLRESGNDVENMSDEQLQITHDWLEGSIVGEKKKANQVVENRLVEVSLKKIEDRLRGRMGTGGYKTFGGEATLENGYLTEDRRKDIETKLRGAIGALRKSQIDNDFINYGKLVRGSIDPKWYKRYVAGGIEAAIGFALVNWVVVPAVSSWAKAKFAAGAVKEGVKQVVSPNNVLDIPPDIGIPSDAASELVGAMPGPEEAMLPLKDNLWNMGKELLQQQGVTDPTNGQIMEVTKQLALDNQTSVAKWGMNAGKWIDSMMPKGLPVSIGGALRVASLVARAASVI